MRKAGIITIIRTLIIVHFITILLKLKSYTIWDQITFVINDYTTVNPAGLIESFNAHTLRLLLMYPIIKTSEILKIEMNYFFSIIVVLITTLTVQKAIKIQENLSSNKNKNILIAIAIIGISYFMNGRATLAFLGITSICLSLLKYSNKKERILTLFFNIVLGLWLCSVSSGSFSVAFLSLIIHMLLQLKYIKLNINSKLTLTLVLIIVITPVIFLMRIFISKNLAYYDYSWVNMLNHGAGEYINDPNIFLILIPIVPMIIITVLFLINHNKKNLSFISLFPYLISGFSIGIFGYTSFWTAYPLYVIAALNFAKRTNRHSLNQRQYA